MLLIMHVGVALASVGYTAYVFFYPSRTKLYSAYVLIAGTLLTGTVLVVQNPAHLPGACSTGLLYIAVMFVGIASIRTKLTRILSE
ncbi:MAG TPA: hypothetical protein VJG64_00485 [Candidatus Paceibacterota bacterium]